MFIVSIAIGIIIGVLCAYVYIYILNIIDFESKRRSILWNRTYRSFSNCDNAMGLLFDILSGWLFRNSEYSILWYCYG